ncbi:unnamed protein product [Dovyalis caffra]|uniref:Uncharacterized protein n=1 Tax=Dovyalis caffra TaxID=77055 RepID=A0AAV1RJY6_9ROSI|nr:unnamed protein product [Dovyalis caffra]
MKYGAKETRRQNKVRTGVINLKCGPNPVVGLYIPDATNAVYDVLKHMSQLHASKKKRYAGEEAEILGNITANLITKETLKEKLAEHVEKVDYEMALEYATQSGVTDEPREDVFIQTLEPDNKFVEFQSPVFVFRLVCQ